MKKETLQKHLEALLTANGPLKARQLVAIFSKEFGKPLDKSQVNSVLYSMKAEGRAKVDKAYMWTLSGNPNPPECEEPHEESAEPLIEFTPEQDASDEEQFLR